MTAQIKKTFRLVKGDGLEILASDPVVATKVGVILERLDPACPAHIKLFIQDTLAILVCENRSAKKQRDYYFSRLLEIDKFMKGIFG